MTDYYDTSEVVGDEPHIPIGGVLDGRKLVGHVPTVARRARTPIEHSNHGDYPDPDECEEIRASALVQGLRPRMRGSMAEDFAFGDRILDDETIENYRHRDLRGRRPAGRDDMLTRVSGQLCGFLAGEPGVIPHTIFALLWPVVEQLELDPREGDDDWREIAWSMCKRFFDGELEQLAAQPEEEAESARALGTDGSDTGNAELFAALCGEYLRFAAELGYWIAYEDGRWVPDIGAVHAIRGTKKVVAHLRAQVERLSKALASAKASGDDELASGLARDLKIARGALKRAASESGRRAMVNLAKSEPGMAIGADELDAHPYLLNCASGTLDLRTGSFRDHDREDFLTQRVEADFDTSAKCPRFERFMADVFPDTDVRAFMQRLMGLLLTGEHLEQVVAFLWGDGRNGKSTLLNVVHDVLADYAKTASRGVFKASNGNDATKDYAVADLRNARFVSSVEVGTNSTWDEETLKALSGGDTLKGRFPYGRPFEFEPTFTPFIAANDKPRVRDQSEGFWRRMLLIPFEATFEGTAAVKDMRQQLRAEGSGILNYMLEGLRRYRTEGLTPPERVRAATAEYRTESNLQAQFIAERCERDPESAVKASALYAAWRVWCLDNGARFIGSQTAFGLAMTRLGIEKTKSRGVNRYVGIRLHNFTRRAE